MRWIRAGGIRVLVVAAAACAFHATSCRLFQGPENPPLAPLEVQYAQDDLGRTSNYPSAETRAAESLAAALANGGKIPPPTGPARPLQILGVSGGGQYGAYSAGVLVGWTQRGDRPDFDVITGISSGAFAASIAFIGPKWDWLLTKVFTTLDKKQLIDVQPIRSIFRTQSLASNAPMKAVIDREVTGEFCADLRAEHAKGRRCYIGTMNQSTRRVVIWDLGAVACSGRPDADDLVRKVLLAAAAIPSLLPAVEFDVAVNGVNYRELHADGGTVCQSFICLPPGATGNLCGSKVYIIAGGKVYVDPLDGRPDFLTRTRDAVSGTLYALYRADLWRVYATCVTLGMEFRHTAVPQEMKLPTSAFSFEPPEMVKIYNAGLGAIARDDLWRTNPPGTTGDEVVLPRAGFRFTTPLPADCPTVQVPTP
jgi:hypothetical protein